MLTFSVSDKKFHIVEKTGTCQYVRQQTSFTEKPIYSSIFINSSHITKKKKTVLIRKKKIFHYTK